MLNSYMNLEEIEKEYKRLLLVKADKEHLILSFAFGSTIDISINELESDLYFLEKELLLIRKRLKIL